MPLVPTGLSVPAPSSSAPPLPRRTVSPISCQGRGPLPGLPRSPQRWHPGLGAHNGPRPSAPSPFLPGPLPVPIPHPSPQPAPPGSPVPSAASPWAPGPPPGRAGLGAPPASPVPLTALLRIRLFPGKFLPAPQAGEGFPEQRLGHAGAPAGPSASPGSGRAAPRPPPRPAVAPRPPPAQRQQEAHSGNAWPKLFFFPSRGLSGRCWEL